MKIAQVAPLFERVPPKLYGGTERVVYNLTEELVNLGHDVTLFASADSITSARLEPMAETGTRLSAASDPYALHIAMLDEVQERAGEFDVIHSHVDVMGFPFARSSQAPTITTMHGRLDFPERRRVLSRFHSLPLVSISDSQRAPVTDLAINWVGTVHNGVSPERFPVQLEPHDPPYLVFLGRISPEKGPDRAIEIARRSGMSIKIAAKIDPADRVWAREHFLPLLDLPGVEFLGEVDDVTKCELLGGATALLFPINWPEPFGMVMIESLACGTPVIAIRGGSVEEVLVDGETGFICDDVDDAVQSVNYIGEIERTACRRRVEAHFSSRAMALGYETVYRRVVEGKKLLESTVPQATNEGIHLPGKANVIHLDGPPAGHGQQILAADEESRPAS